ncbi:MAG: tRNA 2-thiocytidine(32) synthetase TtcA [Waddliaceae bacterium]|nr:tRNA 2-thiocytidine(32) synthetase TtcA [Waddliaceae bacterium]
MNSLIPKVDPKKSQLGRRLESLVRKALYDFHLAKDCKRMAVALSGGKDSLTLLYLLHAISGYGFPPFELVAIHVSGEFSCGAGIQPEYLSGICESLGVPLVFRESTQTLDTLECYSCSRERRKLLFDAAKEHGCDRIAFGHHRDDNAQTLLLNLLHKAEFAGNLPMVHMQNYEMTITRPLIYCSESDIRTFSKANGFARILCRCPVGQNSKRKQVDQLMDEMEEFFPNVRTNLAQASLQYGSEKANRP